MKALLLMVMVFAATLANAAPAILAPQIAKIDQAVEASYVTAKIKGNPIVDDATFVRRAYLAIAGRIPTLAEYDQFTKSSAADKRAQLTAYLVRSAAFTSNMYNFWAEQLRLRERLNGTNNINGILYINYLKKQISTNVPYDKFVSELLTSEGNYFQSPQTGYLMRDLGMPLDNLVATSRVFMGIDIGCAQCHDDPFHDWTQMRFYQFAALFNNAEANGRKNPSPLARESAKRLRDQVEQIVKADQTKRGLNNQVNNFVNALFSGVSVEPSKKLTLPHDYKYKDGSPNQVVTPQFLIGSTPVSPAQDGDLRRQAAQWITAPQHPTFTKNIVNRLWGMMMGQPIIDNVNNIYASDKLNDPVLLALESVMKDVKYSVRDFVYVVANTKAFNRAVYNGPYNGDNYVFIGPKLVRLSAEQLWDSVLAFTTENVDSFAGSYGDRYLQAMVIPNFDEVSLQTVQQHMEALATANRTKYDGAPTYKGYHLIRASEINDTGATATIIQQLGRSDRELIGTSSREGSVTQVISLVNGALADIATAKTSALMQHVQRMSPSDRVDTAFRSILSRRATIAEKASFATVPDDDLVWTLVNTNEFRFSK